MHVLYVIIYFSTCVNFKLIAEKGYSTKLYWVSKGYEGVLLLKKIYFGDGG